MEPPLEVTKRWYAVHATPANSFVFNKLGIEQNRTQIRGMLRPIIVLFRSYEVDTHINNEVSLRTIRMKTADWFSWEWWCWVRKWPAIYGYDKKDVKCLDRQLEIYDKRSGYTEQLTKERKNN